MAARGVSYPFQTVQKSVPAPSHTLPLKHTDYAEKSNEQTIKEKR